MNETAVFTHLHVHTQYSILDGVARIKDLFSKAKLLGMEALAITDHGNMFGVLAFANEADKVGIKPIIGCELYVAEGSRFEKRGREDRSGYHLILLAKNEIGYRNLSRLCSMGFQKEAFYYTPRIDRELLAQYHEGLIACSACLGGEIAQYIMDSNDAKVHDTLQFYRNLFGDDYYLEVQNHIRNPEQPGVTARILEYGKEYGIKCIATNDIHFVEKDDFQAHRILICLNTNRKLSEDKEMHYTGEEYLKSVEEMNLVFPDHPELLRNTQEIVDKIEMYKLTREVLLPKFPLPEAFSDEMVYLRHITHEGSLMRWGEEYTKEGSEIKERVEFELDTVERMGFPGYFLIVWDFVKYARDNGVLVGPGRGSAAGSAVAYAIGITNVDPVKYKLLFERFLNPERISMPDVDIDFDDIGREKVIQYVTEKYGSERVAQIITFGTMAAKSSIKDVARVLELPLSEANRLAGMIPGTPGITLDNAIKENPDFRKECEEGSELVKRTLRYARQLEGNMRSTGTHACGMIIAPENLIDYVPLSTAKDTDMPVTQFEGSLVESVGLLKMDFLGLKTLTIIRGALDNIKLRHNIDIDIETLPLQDPATYELFSRGDTSGVFQFESDGMKKYLRDLKPSRFEDLIAMNALYRPGPMEYIPKYIRRKHGTEKICFDLPCMDEYLLETYGITVYQEQVMLLSQKLANFTKGDADTLRKAMGKKQIETLQKMKSKFTEGCKENGHPLDICDKIWDDWESFASYAFNKSHSTCYAYIAFQTAYLKTHYPAEFMASVLTNNLSDISKITFFTDECKHLKIDLFGPDVNESQRSFTVNKAGAIRFGLAGIKNVGEAAVDTLIEERKENGEYKDIFDFVQRSNLRAMNKKSVESLVKSGAFDSFKTPSRATYFYQKPGDNTLFLDNLLSYAAKQQAAKNSTQVSLFGEESGEDCAFALDIPFCPEWSNIEQLRYEKEVAGFYFSGHPLDDFKLEIDQFKTCTLADFKDESKPLSSMRNKILKFGGVVSKFNEFTAKNGNLYGRFELEDYDQSYEFTLFKEDYLKFRHLLIGGNFVFIHAQVKQRWNQEDQYELSITNMYLLTELLSKHTRKITIRKNLFDINANYTAEIKRIIEQARANPKAKDVSTASLSFYISDSLLGYGITLPSRETKLIPDIFVKQYLQFDSEVEIELK